MTNQIPSETNIIFFNAASTNAASSSFVFIFPSNAACLKFWGDWDGASIQFQTLVPPINAASKNYYIPITFITGQSTFSADGQVTLDRMVYGDTIRCVISSAGASTNINVTAQIVRA